MRGVLVQRMFVPGDRFITLGIYCPYCILGRPIVKYSFSEATMLAKPEALQIPLPKGWQAHVKSAAAKAGIALLQFDDSLHEIRDGPLRPGFSLLPDEYSRRYFRFLSML